MSTKVTVTNNPDQHRYEAVVDTATCAGYVEYSNHSDHGEQLFNVAPSTVSS